MRKREEGIEFGPTVSLDECVVKGGRELLMVVLVSRKLPDKKKRWCVTAMDGMNELIEGSEVVGRVWVRLVSGRDEV